MFQHYLDTMNFIPPLDDTQTYEEVFKQGINDKNKIKEALDKIIDEVDENKDGKIQFNEFVHIMTKMLK